MLAEQKSPSNASLPLRQTDQGMYVLPPVFPLPEEKVINVAAFALIDSLEQAGLYPENFQSFPTSPSDEGTSEQVLVVTEVQLARLQQLEDLERQRTQPRHEHPHSGSRIEPNVATPLTENSLPSLLLPIPDLDLELLQTDRMSYVVTVLQSRVAQIKESIEKDTADVSLSTQIEEWEYAYRRLSDLLIHPCFGGVLPFWGIHVRLNSDMQLARRLQACGLQIIDGLRREKIADLASAIALESAIAPLRDEEISVVTHGLPLNLEIMVEKWQRHPESFSQLMRQVVSMLEPRMSENTYLLDPQDSNYLDSIWSVIVVASFQDQPGLLHAIQQFDQGLDQLQTALVSNSPLWKNRPTPFTRWGRWKDLYPAAKALAEDNWESLSTVLKAQSQLMEKFFASQNITVLPEMMDPNHPFFYLNLTKLLALPVPESSAMQPITDQLKAFKVQINELSKLKRDSKISDSDSLQLFLSCVRLFEQRMQKTPALIALSAQLSRLGYTQ